VDAGEHFSGARSLTCDDAEPVVWTAESWPRTRSSSVHRTLASGRWRRWPGS